MRVIFIVVAFFVLKPAFCQTLSALYLEQAKQADNLFMQNNYKDAIVYYQKAFSSNNDLAKVIHRYRAAICWTFLDKADSAFFQLERIALKGKFADYELISSDMSFITLWKDERWERLMMMIKKNQAGVMRSLNVYKNPKYRPV